MKKQFTTCLFMLVVFLSCSKNDKELSPIKSRAEALSETPAFLKFAGVVQKQLAYIRAREASQNARVGEETTFEQAMLEFNSLELTYIGELRSSWDLNSLDEATVKAAFYNLNIEEGFKNSHCNNSRNNTVNECWKEFGWDQFWSLLKGPLSWGDSVDNVKKFTNCNREAEKVYMACIAKEKIDGVPIEPVIVPGTIYTKPIFNLPSEITYP